MLNLILAYHLPRQSEGFADSQDDSKKKIKGFQSFGVLFVILFLLFLRDYSIRKDIRLSRDYSIRKEIQGRVRIQRYFFIQLDSLRDFLGTRFIVKFVMKG